ncbi:RlpA-like double-psi beta-barrel-protein domain-containing protein-containing protein, partial [Mycena olivaceomarginata]
ASYYDPDDNFGACGWVLHNSDFAVALGEDTWANGGHCGKTIDVTCTHRHNGVTISVIVADRCPGCNSGHGAYSIDLVEGAMAALDSDYLTHGIDTVQWTGFF